MGVTPETLLEETSELLDDLIPVLQSSIDSLQSDLNPEQTVLQRLLGQEIDRQEELLLKAEDVNDRLLNHLNQTEGEAAEDELPENELPEYVPQRVRRQDYPLAVTMPDEERICLKKGSWTLAKVIDKLGVDRIIALGLMSNSVPLVHPRRLRRAAQARSGRYYIATNTSTAEKKEQLEDIARILNVQLKVEQLNIEEENS